MDETGTASAPSPEENAGGARCPSAVRLEILAGSRRDEVESLAVPGTYVFGCSPDCDVAFDPLREPFVSGHHASLRLYPGRAEVEDRGSRNGTLVNGHPIGESHRVYSGDLIDLGEGGPRLRFDAVGTGYVRDLEKRVTAVLPRRAVLEAGGEGGADGPERPRPAEAGAPLGRRLAVPLLAAVAVAALAVLLFGPSAPPEGGGAEGEEVGSRLVADYGRAVFLLAMRVRDTGFVHKGRNLPEGYLIPVGTAWAFDREGHLATCGHVLTFSRAILDRHGRYVEFVAVQNLDGEFFLPVETRFHPDYREGEAASLATDVAIVTLDRPVSVAFPLASRARALALTSGESVFSMGFPIETVGDLQNFYGYSSPEHVLATIRQGWIQRVTSPDGRVAEPAERTLVHVGIPTVGGQSGSPVFGRDGRVLSILNATGLFQLSSGGDRMPHPGMFTYSVRIDVLLDMLDAPAEPVPPRPALVLPPPPSEEEGASDDSRRGNGGPASDAPAAPPRTPAAPPAEGRGAKRDEIIPPPPEL